MQAAEIRKSGWLALAAFLAVVIVAGSTIGVLTAPGQWYQALAKPPLNPPNAIFAPVWLVLYVFIAVAGWRTWRRDPGGREFRFWVAQLALNWLWSPVFFTFNAAWPAFVVIALIWLLIALFIAGSRKKDPVAALLFVPYLAWVSFAAYLNLGVAILN